MGRRTRLLGHRRLAAPAVVSGRPPQGLALAVIIGLTAAGLLRLKLDRLILHDQQRAGLAQVSPVEPPSPTALRVLAGGFDRAAADLVWLTTIQYWGGGNPDEAYDSLAARLETVTALDSNWPYPFLLGGLILPWQNEPDRGLRLLEQGITRWPNDPLFPYYAGATARIYLQDNRLAAHYFTRAAALPGAPKGAGLLAALCLTDAGDTDVALAWWTSLAESGPNETIRQQAAAWRDRLLADKTSN